MFTDGKENDECKADCDGPRGAEALAMLSPAVKTYVIGLGVNASVVDAIAKAGGTGAWPSAARPTITRGGVLVGKRGF